MTDQQINTAAREHAKLVLGTEEFIKNKDAAKAIAEDFKAGVKWQQENNIKEIEKFVKGFYKENGKAMSQLASE